MSDFLYVLIHIVKQVIRDVFTYNPVEYYE